MSRRPCDRNFRGRPTFVCECGATVFDVQESVGSVVTLELYPNAGGAADVRRRIYAVGIDAEEVVASTTLGPLFVEHACPRAEFDGRQVWERWKPFVGWDFGPGESVAVFGVYDPKTGQLVREEATRVRVLDLERGR